MMFFKEILINNFTNSVRFFIPCGSYHTCPFDSSNTCLRGQSMDYSSGKKIDIIIVCYNVYYQINHEVNVLIIPRIYHLFSY
uniref:Uncharacterized protein n=1 Tax=Rhizophagus irregularis (strain DAOM 181602 / DAOM 197198 / MUCL 43194) TaxID=747089 RepID=U9UKY0_RHIID